MVSAVFNFTTLRQVSGCKKDTPKIFNIGIQFIICQLRMDFLNNLPAFNQLFNLITSLQIRLIDKPSYNRISTRIRPIIFRLCIWIRTQFVTIANHIPWTIYVYLSKLIATIIIRIRLHRLVAIRLFRNGMRPFCSANLAV